MVVQSKFKAHILSGDGPTTLQGSEIDYFLVSNTLHGSLELELTWEVPWRPHCALNLKYHTEHLSIPVQQMRAFPPIGRALNPQHGWSEFQEPNGPFYILNYQITGLGTDLARWCAKSESYLTQQIQQPRRGRGSQVDFFTGPLAGPHPAQLWKKGRPAFWEKMSVRISVLHHSANEAVKQDLLNMLPNLAEHASEDLDQDDFSSSVD